MSDRSFLIRLSISIFGLLLIILVIVAILGGIDKIINDIRIEKQAIQVVVEVREKRIRDGKAKYTMYYEIDGKGHWDNVTITDNTLQEGSKTYAYYLPKRENKIYLSKESNVFMSLVAFGIYVILLSPALLFGIKCLKKIKKVLTKQHNMYIIQM